MIAPNAAMTREVAHIARRASEQRLQRVRGVVLAAGEGPLTAAVVEMLMERPGPSERFLRRLEQAVREFG